MVSTLCKDVHDKLVTIERGMTEEEENALITCLRNNQDVFAWSKRDFKGVPCKVIEHALRLDPKIPPKRQKLRVISPQKELAAQSEVEKLLDAGGHQRNTVHNLAFKHSDGTEEEWGTENVH
jgi:hypothetical protein